MKLGATLNPGTSAWAATWGVGGVLCDPSIPVDLSVPLVPMLALAAGAGSPDTGFAGISWPCPGSYTAKEHETFRVIKDPEQWESVHQMCSQRIKTPAEPVAQLCCETYSRPFSEHVSSFQKYQIRRWEPLPCRGAGR